MNTDFIEVGFKYYIRHNARRMKKKSARHSGYIMSYVILAFFIIVLIGIAFLNIAQMESKTCRYGSELKQAHEAARAGAEWAMEEILASLGEQSSREELPSCLLIPGTHQLGNDSSLPVGFIIEPPGAVLDYSDQDSCIYLLTCTGFDDSSRRTLKAKCQYRFSIVYDYGAGGESLFKCRIYLDRGRIIDMNIEP